MTLQKIIEASAVNVLNFIIQSMIEHAFLLAHANELRNLKDIIPAETFAVTYGDGYGKWSQELKLLEQVTDQPVVMLMKAIRKVEQHVKNYCRTNNLDSEELLFEDEVKAQSMHTWDYIMGQMQYENYGEILESLGWMMDRYGLLIWNLAHQQMLGRQDVYLETELEFFSWDKEVASLSVGNGNAKFLLAIYTDIQLDAAAINDFKTAYNG